MYGPDFEKEAAELVARYPQPRGAVMPLLWLVQSRVGHVPLEAEQWIASRLGLTPSFVHGITTFYTMYRTAPAGKHVVQVCTTVSCMLRGSDPVLAHIKQKLGIEVGETTPDGMFTLVTVECLGSCGTAPTIQVNDDYYEDMDIARTNEILDALARGEKPKPGPGPHRVYVE
ncbi:MAG: dehydrogenase chain [Acidobacteria bacterium]|nr:dehydrogenase chain [Acidobacteriota bacterium]